MYLLWHFLHFLAGMARYFLASGIAGLGASSLGHITGYLLAVLILAFSQADT